MFISSYFNILPSCISTYVTKKIYVHTTKQFVAQELTTLVFNAPLASSRGLVLLLTLICASDYPPLSL